MRRLETVQTYELEIKGKVFEYKDYDSIATDLDVHTVSIVCVKVQGPKRFIIAAISKNNRKRKMAEYQEVSFGHEIELMTSDFTIKNSSYFGLHFFNTALNKNCIEILHKNILNFGLCLPCNKKNSVRFSDWTGIVAKRKKNTNQYQLEICSTDCKEIS